MSKKTSPKKILLVDDDPDIRESVVAALESRGYVALAARDGNQGQAMAEFEEPDLVVLDMMMPKRSGFIVLEWLRKNSKKLVPVIMITANEGNRHQTYAETLGVHSYLRKPFPMDKLLDSVDKAFEKNTGK